MNMVLVVGDSTALTTSETVIQDRLVTTLGHTVTVVDDQAAAPDLSATDLVVFAPNSNFNFIGTKYDNAPCGIFSMRLEPHTEISDSSFPGGGNTSSAIFIEAPGDPLVGGLTGTVNVLSGTPALNYQYFDRSSFSPETVIVGLSSSGGTRVLLARIVQGGELHNGQFATTRRVFWGVNDTWPELFNADGWAIFENAVTWASAPPGQLPLANAGINQKVQVNTLVQLDGGASSDADGTVASYTWRLISTSGPSVVLSSATVPSPTFTAPATACTLVFGLKVVDNDSLRSLEDTVTIQVYDHMNVKVAIGGSWVDKPQYIAKAGSWY